MSAAARWSRVRALFAELIELPLEARAAALERGCGGDPGLRAELEQLLSCAAEDDGGAPFGLAGGGARFELQQELAAGRAGRVQRARQRGVPSEVVLRIVALGEEGAARVGALRALGARLEAQRHPALARVLETGLCADGAAPALYLASEYVDGAVPARTHAAAHSAQVGLELVRTVSRCVVELHAHGLCHGKLAAHNVVVDRAGRVRILDLGVALVCAQGAPPSPAGDVVALAVLLRTLLAAPGAPAQPPAPAALALARRAQGGGVPLGDWVSALERL